LDSIARFVRGLSAGWNRQGDRFQRRDREIEHFGLAPSGPLAIAVIALELGASVMILTGFYRWLGALALAGFTLMATLIALRFWELPAGQERFMAANAFFEHLGLVGGFILVAWYDLRGTRLYSQRKSTDELTERS
jgi:uncharacterized membrane protein YphA (DoxX/SURF4 family)